VTSYSQEGEDVLLSRIFSCKEVGFYVDVGAHHPKRFSNTYRFYKAGWRGINIEPNPDAIKLFKRFRARDINVNCGIAGVEGNLDYFMFDEPALNTFDGEVLKSRISNTQYKHIQTMHINVFPLAEVLSQNVSNGTKIDFFSIDVEGFDLEVLKSNDWIKYRPDWVLAEQLNLDNLEDLDFEMHHYMKSVNYKLFAKTFNTLFYKNMNLSV
jgi:FkbM family methyltransferase